MCFLLFAAVASREERVVLNIRLCIHSCLFSLFLSHTISLASEWGTSPAVNRIDHTYNGILAVNHFPMFFVNEARKSNHTFENPSDLRSRDIYNFTPTYTGNVCGFSQTYFFKNQH